jgi:hypothetical protein
VMGTPYTSQAVRDLSHARARVRARTHTHTHTYTHTRARVRTCTQQETFEAVLGTPDIPQVCVCVSMCCV